MDALWIVNTLVTGCTVLLGVFGNCLVMISVNKFSWLKMGTNYFVMMLSFYDFCNGLPIFTLQVIAPELSVDYGNITNKYELCCIVQSFIALFSGYGSVLCIIIVTVDRYLFINWPMRYHQVLSNSRALMVSAACFMTVLAVTVLGIYGQPVRRPCSVFRMYNPKVVKYIGLPTTILGCVLVMILYGKIGCVACKAKNSNPSHMSSNGQSGSSQNKVTKVISLVIGVFMVTYIVFFSVFMVTNDMTENYARWIQTIAIWIWRVSRK